MKKVLNGMKKHFKLSNEVVWYSVSWRPKLSVTLKDVEGNISSFSKEEIEALKTPATNWGGNLLVASENYVGLDLDTTGYTPKDGALINYWPDYKHFYNVIEPPSLFDSVFLTAKKELKASVSLNTVIHGRSSSRGCSSPIEVLGIQKGETIPLKELKRYGFGIQAIEPNWVQEKQNPQSEDFEIILQNGWEEYATPFKIRNAIFLSSYWLGGFYSPSGELFRQAKRPHDPRTGGQFITIDTIKIK